MASSLVFTDFCESGAAAALVLETGNRRFAVDASFVDEILTSRPVTPVPGIEPPVRGLVRSRSRLVPVLDSRHLLEGESSRGDGVIVVMKVPECSARRWIALEAERVAGARSREESDDGGRELPPLVDLRRFLDVEGR
jgi:chemotaxis signal transduction protein